MNYKFIDLFAGIGGFHSAFHDLGAECVFASENNLHSRKTYQVNFLKKSPELFRSGNFNEDILSIEPDKIPDHDILCAGFPCFAAGTKVKTSEGYVAIENLKIGDMVLTQQGNYKPVTCLMTKDNAPIIEVKAQGMFEALKTTHEHPFWIKKTKKDAPEWIDAKDIQKGYFVGYRVTEGNLEIESLDFWYMVGRYLGDGWIQNQQRSVNVTRKNWKVLICTNHEDAEDLQSKIKLAGYNSCISVQKTCTRLIICSKKLVQFLLPFGKYAYGKTLPGWCSNLTLDRQKALFQGWIESDGHTHSTGKVRLSSVSENLIMSMAEIGRNVYKVPVSLRKSKVNPTTVIEGRTVNQRDIFILDITFNERYGFYEDGHIWCLVKDYCKTVNRDIVYNISVQDDETYTVSGVSVHNCQPFSQIGKLRGFHEETEERGQMFFSICSILIEKKPKAIFLENVRNLLTHDGGNTFKTIKELLDEIGYVITYKIVHASDYGLPQNRPRIFIVGFRKDIYNKKFQFPEKIPLKYTMSDVFGGKCTRKIGFTIRVGGRGSGINDRRNWDAYSVDGKQVRLTSAEGKKMMGLPDDFVFPVSEAEAMKQLGNSVAVSAIQIVGNSIIEYLNKTI